MYTCPNQLLFFNSAQLFKSFACIKYKTDHHPLKIYPVAKYIGFRMESEKVNFKRSGKFWKG